MRHPMLFTLMAVHDERLLNKAIRVLATSISPAHEEVTINYLRLVLAKVKLGSSKAMVQGWINDFHVKKFTPKRATLQTQNVLKSG